MRNVRGTLKYLPLYRLQSQKKKQYISSEEIHIDLNSTWELNKGNFLALYEVKNQWILLFAWVLDS